VGGAASDWPDWCCASLLRMAGAELLLEMLSAAAQEGSLLLLADESLPLTAAAVGLAVLLAPFPWQGGFLPVLPQRMREELLQACNHSDTSL